MGVLTALRLSFFLNIFNSTLLLNTLRIQKLGWLWWGQDSIAWRLFSEMSESLDGVSVSTSFAQSRLVSVSTSEKFLSLDESRSRHPRNLSVSMSLGLDIHKISKSCWVIKQRKAKQKESNQTRYNQSKSIHLLDWVCFLQHQILTFDGWVSPVR